MSLCAAAYIATEGVLHILTSHLLPASFTLAVLAVVITLIGGKGWEAADAWAALVACCFIVYNAYHIFCPVFGEIMDEAPAGT